MIEINASKNLMQNSSFGHLNSILKDIKNQKYEFIEIINNESHFNIISKRSRHIKKFKQVVVIGIGGSSLGLKTIVNALDLSDKVIFLETLDSVSLKKKINKIKFLSTHFVVISKSGGTLETIELFKFILKKSKFKSKKISNHFTFISDSKVSFLNQTAQKLKIPLIEIPENLGGRFSVLSAVGMLVSDALGQKSKLFLKGAQAALADEDKVAFLSQHLLNSFKNKKWITCFWIYSERLHSFGNWFEQLWSESLAKTDSEEKRVSTPKTLIGSQDQHSQLQQFVEGFKDKYFIFLRVKEEETSIPSIGKVYKTQVQAVQRSLKEVGVDSLELSIKKVTPEALGYLFMFFQLSVVVISRILEVDPFNQPGVERAKILTKQLL